MEPIIIGILIISGILWTLGSSNKDNFIIITLQIIIIGILTFFLNDYLELKSNYNKIEKEIEKIKYK